MNSFHKNEYELQTIENKFDDNRQKHKSHTVASNQVYCRLCAEMKPADKQFDLASDAERLQETVDRMVQLKAVVPVDMTADDTLPKTICHICYDILARISQFLQNVQRAQELLKKVFAIDTKMEITEEIPVDYLSYEDYYLQDPEDESDKKLVLVDKKLVPIPIKEESSERELVLKVKQKKNNSVKRYCQIDLVHHNTRETWAGYTWKCRECPELFPTLSGMREHALEHGTCMLFACADCNRKTYNFDGFITHVRKHRKHLKYVCHICDTKFDKSASVREHMLAHKISNQCLRCGECFESEEALTEHMEKYASQATRPSRKKLTEVVTDVKCPECGKLFKSKAKLYVHRKIHADRHRDHTCDVCGKAFFNRGTLTSHLKTHVEDKPFRCKICPGAFKTQRQLRGHVLTHSNTKPWCCETCGRGFRTRSQLKAHMIVHTDSMPFSCEYCGKAFRFKTVLKLHLRQHTGCMPYSCAQCPRDFSNWSNYNKHMKRRHNTDMAKRKRTSEGVFHVNPLTEQVHSVQPDVKEWKDEIVKKKKKKPEDLTLFLKRNHNSPKFPKRKATSFPNIENIQ